MFATGARIPHVQSFRRCIAAILGYTVNQLLRASHLKTNKNNNNNKNTNNNNN